MNESNEERTRAGMILEKSFVIIVREIVRLIVLCLWCIIGFFFWVPLLLRMVAYFTWSIAVSSFTGVSMAKGQKGLDRAIRFYALGFKNINYAVTHGSVADESAPSFRAGFLSGILPDLAFTVLFWVVLGLIYGIIMIDIPQISTFIADLIDFIKTYFSEQVE
ncbi:MAG: hypothetical protein SVY10_13635 [Thermodesulfobacteriota bacterium]|nr:hypothetical protein [Thermodesulfobacteriota bacterium]